MKTAALIGTLGASGLFGVLILSEFEASSASSGGGMPEVMEQWDDLDHGLIEDAPLNQWTLFRMGGLTRYATFDHGELGVDITTLEKSAGTRYWWNKPISTSFGIHYIVARHADELIVAGESGAGNLVLERWTVHPPDGALVSTHESAGQPFGTSIPVVSTQVSVKGAGGFIPPQERQETPIASRSRFFDDSGIGLVKAIAVDPEGRYVLCQERGTGDVYQVIIANSSFQKILDSGDYPFLEEHTLFGVMEDGLGGRIFPIGDRGGSTQDGWMVLEVGDNSGLLPPALELTADDFESSYPMWQMGGTWKVVQ